MTTQPLGSYPTTIRFQDIDAAGIIFFARVLDMMHDAFVAHLASRGIDLAAALRDKTWGAPLAHAEADYKRPMRFGDRVVVQISAIERGNSSLTVRYVVHGEGDEGDVRATGMLKHVVIDPGVGRPMKVPDSLALALER